MAGTGKAGSRGSRTVIDSSGLFSKGLNTELHEIEDAAVFSSDECNCAIRANGSRSRRLGIDYEEGYKFLPENSLDVNNNYAYTSFEWTQIKGLSSKRYLVVQAGSKLFFYENVGAPFSQRPDTFVLDLNDEDIQKVKGATKDDVASEPCKFTQAYGGLFVCSKAILPFYIESLEKPESGESVVYSNVYASLNMTPTETSDKSLRAYDPVKHFYYGGSEVMNSHFVGYHAGNSIFKRYVVKDKEGKKVGRIPFESYIKTKNRLPSEGEMYNSALKGAAYAIAITAVFGAVAGPLGIVIGAIVGALIGNEKKVYYYTTDVLAYDSDEVIGTAVFKDADQKAIILHDFDGNLIGESFLCNDFYETPGENPDRGEWPFGSKQKVWHAPTALYYEDLWNNGDGLLGKDNKPLHKSAREKTGLKAYAVTPYTLQYPGQPISSMRKGTIDIAEVGLSIPVEPDSKRDPLVQKEYMVFVTEDTSVPPETSIEIKTTDWTDKISHRDANVYERTAYFSKVKILTSFTGLQIRIRDLKGCPDILNTIDYLQGPNVALPPGSLSRAHKYNLYNQGWNQQVEADMPDGETYASKVVPAINAFYENSADFESTAIGKVYPPNNMQWFVAKDKETQEYTSGKVWEGNRFTKFRPKDLLQYAFGDTPAPKGHFILDYFKQDRNALITDDEVKISEGYDKEIATEYPRHPYVADIVTYAGRIFYLTGDTVLYSQVVLEDLSKAGNCYQEADPTSEVISDIVDTDGGMIQIPEIGEGIRFARVGGTLAVIGTQSTYLISGGSENNFTATAYVGGAIQTYSSSSPCSFVEAEGSVFYWSTVGIVQMAPQQGAVVSNVVSNGTIQTFYDNLSEASKKYCKGFYDYATKELWWIYPEDESNTRSLNKALVLNLKTSAWTRMSFASGSNTPEVVHGMSLSEAFSVEYRSPLYAEERSSEVIGAVVASETEENVKQYFVDGEFLGYENSEGIIREEPTGGKETEYYRKADILYKKPKMIIGYISEDNDILKPAIQPVQAFAEAKIISLKDYPEVAGITIKKGDVLYLVTTDSDIVASAISKVSGTEYKSRKEATQEYPFDGDFADSLVANQRIRRHKLQQYNKITGFWEDIGEVRDMSMHTDIKASEPVDVDRRGSVSSVFVCLDKSQSNITFGVLNNLNYKDWASGDIKGSGYDYESYLVSHPITLDMPYYNKTIPYLLATFRRTEQGFDTTGQGVYSSACQGSILWDWHTNGDSGKWDAQQELYRYDKGTLLDSKYITSKTRVYGSGRAFQVKLSSVGNKAFDIENVGFQMYVDGRI